jgi:hypothetical protein
VFPAWSVNENVRVEVSSYTGLSTQFDNVNVLGYAVRDVKLYNTAGMEVSGPFNRDVFLTIPYRDIDNDDKEDVSVVSVDNLKMFCLSSVIPAMPLSGNPVRPDWLHSVTIDKVVKTITAQVSHFSVFAIGYYTQVQNSLFNCYPNPFTPSRDGYTRIEYSVVIPAQAGIQLSRVSIKVYNIVGEFVRTLIDKEVLGDKSYIDWDGKNDSSEFVSDGLYLCQLVTPSYKQTIKILLIK